MRTIQGSWLHSLHAGVAQSKPASISLLMDYLGLFAVFSRLFPARLIRHRLSTLVSNVDHAPGLPNSPRHCSGWSLVPLWPQRISLRPQGQLQNDTGDEFPHGSGHGHDTSCNFLSRHVTVSICRVPPPHLHLYRRGCCFPHLPWVLPGHLLANR